MIGVYKGSIPLDQLVAILKALYASEIGVSLSSFPDAGWNVRLGDAVNGFKAEASFRNLDDAGPWLVEMARKHYPESVFVKGLGG